MLIVSQNLLNYDVKLKSNTVFRVNLAWTTLKELKKILRRHSKKTIFFDYPDNELDTVPLLKIIKTVEEVVSGIMPDRIYTSHFADLNVDHRTVFED